MSNDNGGPAAGLPSSVKDITDDALFNIATEAWSTQTDSFWSSDGLEAAVLAVRSAVENAPPRQCFDRIAVAELTKIAAECHRAKWEFDLSEDYTPSRALARTIIVNAFKALHRIGDQAMRACEALSVTRPERGNRFCKHDDCPYPDCLVAGGICPSQPSEVTRPYGNTP